MDKLNTSKCFQGYLDRYINLLEKYYPAHGSTGFTERNQSVNFASAVEAVYPDAFTWYEAPIGDRRNEHVDAVIFIPSIHGMVMIESKRFSNTGKKLKDTAADIMRISKRDNHLAVVAGLDQRYKSCLENVYGLVLADVWLETSTKNKIFNTWGKDFFEEFSSIFQPAEFAAKNAEWYKGGYDRLPKYKLLALVFECGD